MDLRPEKVSDGNHQAGQVVTEGTIERLRKRGILPYGSPEMRRYEERLTKAVTRLYRRAEQGNGSATTCVGETRQGPMAEETEELMASHYDQPLEFFQHFLDSRFMAYSMAFFGETPEEAKSSPRTLEEAQRCKFELICKRAEIRGDETVFNLGCGFGSLETFLLQKYPQMEVVGITPSKIQREYLQERMKNPADPLGQGRFSLIAGDFTQLPASRLGAGRYDLVISIGSLEHFKNMLAAFERMAELLKPEGRAFHHLIASRYAIPRYMDSKRSRLDSYFPGARVLPLAALAQQTDHFALQGSWFVNGLNYWRTLDEWQRRFWENMEAVYLPLLKEEGVRHWNEYFCLGKVMFAPLAGTVLGNGQYYFRKRAAR